MSKPIVAIVAGSKSDQELVDVCASVLTRFSVPFETRVISAHRTASDAMEFAQNASHRGLRVVIAVAGKAAHLAGVIASSTVLPVIGVPAQTSDLGGLDSLLSMVQMPSGIPVATVAIGTSGAANAALLAISILSLGDEELEERLTRHRQELADGVRADDERTRNRSS